MTIGIIGAGKLGLAFALLCKKSGYSAIVSDKREDYVYNLNQGICEPNEPLLQKMLFEVDDFRVTTNNLEVIESSDIIFTFVETPSLPNGSFNTTSVFEVTNDFFNASKQDISIFNKKFVIGSTTNPGDVEQIQKKLSVFSIQVGYNPESMVLGEIIKGVDPSDIILIGTEYQELANTIIQIYQKIQSEPVNAHVMSCKAAEITKIAINSFVTAKIAYANMIGDVLTKSNIGEETSSVLNAIGSDTRIGKKYMKYGFGFGGPSLPKDNRSLGQYIKELGIELNFSEIINEFNEEHGRFLKNSCVKQYPDKTIPLVMSNITYKKGTDILDESQQFKLCLDLLEEGYYLNVIENSTVSKQLTELSEQYGGRLKFYKPGTIPEGHIINLK
jgi:UDPglucose 6-dehydrogenase